MEQILISTPYIKLDQFLKFANIVGQGTDAKFLITQGYVNVNNEEEIRRGRKLYAGDIVKVCYNGQTFEFEVCGENAEK